MKNVTGTLSLLIHFLLIFHVIVLLITKRKSSCYSHCLTYIYTTFAFFNSSFLFYFFICYI